MGVRGSAMRRGLSPHTHLTQEVSHWSYMSIWMLVLGGKGGKEGGREGRREGGKEGGREGRREGGRKGGKGKSMYWRK